MPAVVAAHAVAVQEVQDRLAQLIEQIQADQSSVVLLGAQGVPVARLVPVVRPRVRLGLAAGRYEIADPSDALDAEIAADFERLMPSGTPG
jgi:antitoxin (DNA-binding transcriptional repressor) of toxin-antitoxin stability system